MNRAFRVLVLPLLIASPVVLASLSPSRFFADGRCVAWFVLMALGLAFENYLVHPSSVASSNTDEQKKRDRHTFELAALTNIACYYLPVYDYLNMRELLPRSGPIVAIGFALMLLGEGMRVAALLTLGRFFTMRVAVLDGHKVVDRGLYAFVRHPAYTGWFVLSLGVAIFFGSTIGLVGTALFVVVIGLRVIAEERALRSDLGDAYVTYSDRVRYRFIPWVF
jgi:protein-S-isoprenylcysteine O-methyltransferase Ste14